jgi:hypothetical protein
MQMGAAREIHGAAEVAEFSRRARGATPALLNGAPAAVWLPGGQPRVVYDFTISGEKITAIDLIADPASLRQLDLVAALDQRVPGARAECANSRAPTPTRRESSA